MRKFKQKEGDCLSYGYSPYGGYGQYPFAQQAYAPQMQAPPQAVQQQTPPLNIRLVTSREEATTAQIPFDGTINVFLNLGAGEVYIKRFNPATGGAIFSDYLDADRARQLPQAEAKPAQEYATIEMLAALEKRIDEKLKGVKSGD